MTRYVLDAPALLRLVAERVQVHPAHQLVAPSSVRSEALALLLQAVHRGELSERDALAQHDRMTEVKMRLLGDRVSRRTAWRIAREHGWTSTREAEYLAVTTLQADALVADDPGLAATADGLVPTATLSALARPPAQG